MSKNLIRELRELQHEIRRLREEADETLAMRLLAVGAELTRIVAAAEGHCDPASGDGDHQRAGVPHDA